MSRGQRARSDFHRQPVAPSIFAIGDCSNPVPQLAVGLAVKNARRRANLPLPDPDHNLRIAPDVLDPCGGFACFGDQIKAVIVDDKPNLDLARHTGLRPIVVR